MTKTPAIATILAGTMLLAACAAPPVNDRAGTTPLNVRVEYINPEKFTDVGDRSLSSDAVRADYLEQLRRHLLQRAAARLPAGQNLAVSITDVDMAGNFEPWRIRLGDTRIIRDVYPPRINLNFKLTGDNGKVIREGNRQLRNSAFLMSVLSYRNDVLRYEKALLDDWLERELSGRQS